MIEILLNGKTLQLSEPLTIVELLAQKHFDSDCFALAINKEFVPKSFYTLKIIQHGDILDVVTPMQGG
jgi:sulfur carrier protein